ncbi:MAG: hypothetical protein QNK78_02870 [Crocinitomicaceae bacterium]|tara:strand:+ start:249 stop:755 length:507 start_codon:yes stop_codon:yes gene_type:complete
MTYKQGRSFPPSAHGAGLIFAFMAIFIVYLSDNHYWILSFIYITLWIMFSRTKIDTSGISEGVIVRKYGLFPFLFSSKINLKNFDAAVIKQINVSYRTTQSTGFFVISSQKNSSSFTAVQLKHKGKYEFETLFKGTNDEIMEFIKANLTETHLKFYKGIPKPQFEIKI